MINHIIDHALTTIGCTLDGMDAVIEMTTEVDSVSAEAVGYLMALYAAYGFKFSSYYEKLKHYMRSPVSFLE